MRQAGFAFFLLVLISGCFRSSDKELDFDTADLHYFQSFKIGDTIYYESSHHSIDTLIILDTVEFKNKKPAVFITPKNYKWIDIKYLPLDSFNERLYDSLGRVRGAGQRLFGFYKDPIAHTKTIEINFKSCYIKVDAGTVVKHTDTIVLNGKRISNYYVFHHAVGSEIAKDSAVMKDIYWTDEEGLSAYTNVGGETWTRKK